MQQTEIMKLVDEWVPALQSGDIYRNLQFFTDDCVIVGGDSDYIYIGHDQIRKLLPKNCNPTTGG